MGNATDMRAGHLKIRRDRLEYLGLAVVLLLAGWLRLGWPGMHSFGFDEARLSLMALEMAQGGQIARLGMSSSTGIPNLPAAVWLFALPFRLTSDPLWASLGVGALGVLAVLGVWWLARSAWGAWAGLASALIFATSPFAVFYSRSIWAQDLLPPLAVLWAVAGVLGIAQGKGWALALHAFIAGFAFQVHYAGITLVPATAWLILRFRLWARWPSLLLGGALAALCAWPYAHTVWCCAPQVREAWAGLLRGASQIDLTAWRQWFEMASGRNWEWLPLGSEWRWPPTLGWALDAANAILGALVLLSLAALLVALWRDRKAKVDARVALTALLPAWALAGPLVFTRHSSPAYHQYQLAALPAAFVAVGLLFAWRRARLWRGAVAALLVAASLVQAVPVAQALQVNAERLTPGGVGTPLSYPRAAARALQDGGRVIAHAYNDQPDVDGDAAAFRVLFWGYPAQVVDGRSALLIPAVEDDPHPHLLMAFAALPAWGELAASGASGRQASYPRREGEPPYVAYTVDALDTSIFQAVTPQRLANGAQLVGWRARVVEGQWRISFLWQIVGPIQEGRYHQFNHLRNAEGEPLAIRDAPVSSAAWQVGDRLITWADFEPPTTSGPFWVDVGMYTYPEIARVPVLDRPGDPLAPIRLGPFTVE